MKQGERLESLDALRGLAIVGMAWSGMLPNTLPAWMYHGQEPPPDHASNIQIFGITWVDLVFPFFLFAMGASIPIAISRRLDRGERLSDVVIWLIQRGLLLYGFAIFNEHLRAGVWEVSPSSDTLVAMLSGFVLLVLMFVRWPQAIEKGIGRFVTLGAWVAASALIVIHNYPDGKTGFENGRIDVILLVLANVSVTAGLIWLATKCRLPVRFGIMAAVAMVLLTSDVPGSLGKAIWDYTPLQFVDISHWAFARFVPVIYHFEYQKYLLIVLPGTMCGDFILEAMKEPWGEAKRSVIASAFVAIGGIAASAIACYGLFSRQVLATSEILIGLSFAMVLAFLKPQSSLEFLVARMLRLGTALLTIGLLAEPVGGGIRKDSPTLSYFLVSVGLALLFLASLELIFDRLRIGALFRPVTLTGMNPILAYTTITNLVGPASAITGYSAAMAASSLGQDPWQLALVDGGVRSCAVVAIAALCTRFRLFLRA